MNTPFVEGPLMTHLVVAFVLVGFGGLNLAMARFFRRDPKQQDLRTALMNYPRVTLLTSGWVCLVCGVYLFALLGARK